MRSTSANQVQVKAKAGKSGPGTQLYESSDDITLKVGAGEIKMTTSSIKITFGGSCIQLDAGGVYVDGAVVHLNKGSSGGAAAAVSEAAKAAASATTAAGTGPASASKLPTQKATVQAPAKQRPKHVQKFIDQALPAAQKVQQDWGIPVSVTLAQSAQETGWGKSVKNNAYFGIKGVSPTGKSGMFNTTEVIDGKVISISDKFRAYNDFAESADDYGRFLNKNPRYAEALKHKDDPFTFSKEVAKAGYATDPKYADKIASIIKSQGLTDYDE
ncbi:glycoside hydrolase family 73 protein [Serratia fonticola]|uniref:glycoside hydrolase family 73 protein n=2 Tax=Serratia fonticola TaxID=47917 RepID=UPI00301D8FC1